MSNVFNLIVKTFILFFVYYLAYFICSEVINHKNKIKERTFTNYFKQSTKTRP